MSERFCKTAGRASRGTDHHGKSLRKKQFHFLPKAIQGEGGMTLIGKIFETEKEIDSQEREDRKSLYEIFFFMSIR